MAAENMAATSNGPRIDTETTTRKNSKKRSLDETLNEIGQSQPVEFNPLYPVHRKPTLNLPPSINPQNAVDIFLLFFPEHILLAIARSTNAFARNHREKAKLGRSNGHSRIWRDTSPKELLAFIGILIYTGVHDSTSTHSYWNRTVNTGPLHTTNVVMPQYRFEQLKRYLHVSNPNSQENSWFDKLEPLSSHFQHTSKALFGPGSNVAIDEMMIQTFERGSHTYKTPNKPIKGHNHHMNSADNANQLRSSYEIHQTSNRNWLAVFHWIIDQAIVDSYRIQCIWKKACAQGDTVEHQQFRIELYQRLFALSQPLPQQRLDRALSHRRVYFTDKGSCVWCQYKQKRNPTRKGRAGRCTSGCLTCDSVPLCLKGACWTEFHSKADSEITL